MIPKREGWHYLAVNKLSALLRGIILQHDSDFYCLSYRYLFKTKKNLNLMKKNVKIKIFVVF